MKPDFRYKLGSKIVGILILYFVVAFLAIGMTLHVSTQLSGGGAAINDAGSQRMRTYRLAYLVTQPTRSTSERAAMRVGIQAEITQFEQVLVELEQGNPSRPLFLPREPPVAERMAALRYRWDSAVKPMVLQIADAPEDARRDATRHDFLPMIDGFVGGINELVSLIELSNSRHTALLRSLQIGLIVLALMGTVILILWFHMMVLRPVARLHEGIKRMAAADFNVRLPVERSDEFGELAEGFNRMRTQLQALYGTLEERVVEKTRSIEERTRSLADKNKELGTLYEISAFLNESAAVEELCRGFLRRVLANVGLTAGAVRLIDADSNEIRMLVHEGVSEDFSLREAALCSGECLCGSVAQRGVPLHWDLAESSPKPLRLDCRAEGFRGVAVFTIRHQRQVIGIFNLYSAEARIYSERETLLLETLGQHLGLAIESLRLVAREKEMAVSEERNLLAQELHDSIAQSLAFLNIQAQMLGDALGRADIGDAESSLGLMREGIQESYQHVRELLLHFRTRMHQPNLAEALRSTLEKFADQTGVATECRVGESGASLPPESELQALHIVQEALSNVRKHSQAAKVRVELSRRSDARSVTVTVSDDGVGFDWQSESIGTDHVGLRIMRERAQQIGARFDIRSAPGEGTEVRLEVPMTTERPLRRRDDNTYLAG